MSYYGRYSDDEDYDDGYYYEAESYGEDSESDEYEYEEAERGHYTLSTPIEHHASAPPVAEAQAAAGKRKVSSTPPGHFQIWRIPRPTFGAFCVYPCHFHLQYRKRKKWGHAKHPDMPKRCRSAYSLFFLKNRPAVKERLGGSSAKVRLEGFSFGSQ